MSGAPAGRALDEVAAVASHDKTLGPPDPVFERRYRVAYARGALMQVAHDEAEALRREQVAVDSTNLRSAVLMTCGQTMRSAYAIDLSDAATLKLIDLVIIDYLRAAP